MSPRRLVLEDPSLRGCRLRSGLPFYPLGAWNRLRRGGAVKQIGMSWGLSCAPESGQAPQGRRAPGADSWVPAALTSPVPTLLHLGSPAAPRPRLHPHDSRGDRGAGAQTEAQFPATDRGGFSGGAWTRSPPNGRGMGSKRAPPPAPTRLRQRPHLSSGGGAGGWQHPAGTWAQAWAEKVRSHCPRDTPGASGPVTLES